MIGAGEFVNRLIELKDEYSSQDLHNVDNINAFTWKLEDILQDYLWESPNNLDINRERKIRTFWHSDKIASLNLQQLRWLSDDEHKEKFLEFTQFACNNFSSNLLFHCAQQVKNEYLADRRWRATYNAQQAEPGVYGTAGDNIFNFVAQNVNVIYKIFWPLFYLIQCLEQNIQNIMNQQWRNKVLDAYKATMRAPYRFGSFLFTNVRFGMLISYSIGAMSAVLAFAIQCAGLLLVGVAAASMVLSDGHYRKEPKFNDIFYEFFFHIPLVEAPYRVWNKFNPQNNKQKALRAAAYLGTYALGAVYSAGLMYASFYSLPLVGIALAVPAASLICINMPLMTYQFLQSPIKSISAVNDFAKKIFGFYATYAKRMMRKLSTWTPSVSLKSPFEMVSFIPNFLWRAPAHADTQSETQQQAPAPHQGAASPITIKLNKYLTKTVAELVQKRRKHRQKRNEILQQNFRFSENSPAVDMLDEALNEHGIDKDAQGHVIERTEIELAALKASCAKAQVYHLKKCAQDNMPPGLVQSSLNTIAYPKL